MNYSDCVAKIMASWVSLDELEGARKIRYYMYRGGKY